MCSVTNTNVFQKKGHQLRVQCEGGDITIFSRVKAEAMHFREVCFKRKMIQPTSNQFFESQY